MRLADRDVESDRWAWAGLSLQHWNEHTVQWRLRSLHQGLASLAVGETVILLHPQVSLPSVISVSTGMQRGCLHNDSLVDG